MVRRGDAALEEVEPLLRAEVGRERALDLGLRAQHRRSRTSPISAWKLGVLDADVVGDAPVVEDRPADARAAEVLEAPPLEEVGEVLGRDAHRADQREARQQVGLGDADLRALRGERALGDADVGAAAQEIGGDAERDARRRVRDHGAARADQVVEVARRDAEQDRERVLGLPDAGLEVGDERARVFEQRGGLRRVEPGHLAGLELLVGDREAALLDRDVGVRDVEPLLERAELDVVRRHLGEQRHQHVVVRGDRGEQLGVGRLDAAAEPAPEVDLPGRVEAGLPVVEEVVADAPGWRAASLRPTRW